MLPIQANLLGNGGNPVKVISSGERLSLNFVLVLHLSTGLRSLALELNSLDHTDSDGSSHVTNSESSKRSVLGVSLNTHGLLRDHDSHTGLVLLEHKLGSVLLGGLLDVSVTGIDLGKDRVELARNVSSVAIKNGRVVVRDVVVVQDNDLSVESSALGGGLVLAVGRNVSTLDVLNGKTLDVESNIVTGLGLVKSLVVHLNRFALSGLSDRSEVHVRTGLEDTGLDTSDGHGSDTLDLIDILKRKTEGHVSQSLRRFELVKKLHQGDTEVFLLVSGVPGHVGGDLEHVISGPSRDRHELGFLVESLDLEVVLDLGLDLQESLLRVGRSGHVHLVDTADHSLHTEGVGESHVLLGGSLLTESVLELTGSSGNHEDLLMCVG